MSAKAPQWLTQRNGDLFPANDGRGWLVFVNQEALYLLTPAPAAGQFACQVMQTNNGKRLDSGKTFPSNAEALAGGLEDLRRVLGW